MDAIVLSERTKSDFFVGDSGTDQVNGRDSSGCVRVRWYWKCAENSKSASHMLRAL